MTTIDAAEGFERDEPVRSEQDGTSRAAALRFARWLLLCPLVSAALLVAGREAWDPLVSVSSILTVALFETFDGLGESPGHVAEAIRLALAAALAAVAPSLSLAFAKRRWSDWAVTLVAIYPAWLGVMIAPAIVVHQSARHLDPSLQSAHLTADFLLAFSALATSAVLAYAFWARLNPHMYGPRVAAKAARWG